MGMPRPAPGGTLRPRLLDFTAPTPDGARLAADLVQLLVSACSAPVGFVALADGTHLLRLEACAGMDPSRWPRSSPLLELNLLQPGLLEIPDAMADARFGRKTQGIRFYAGMPLRSSDGVPLGVIGVADLVPGRLDPQRREALARLARLAEQQLELRGARRMLEDADVRREELERIARVGTWQLALPERKLECSAESLRLFGIPAAEPSLTDLIERVHEKDRDEFLRALDAAGTHRTPLDLIHRAIRPDGSERLIHARGTPTVRDEGTLLEGTFHDVTLHRRMAWEITSIFELARDLLCVMSFDGRFQRVSASWRTLLGLAPSELMDAPFFDLVHPDDLAATREVWDRVIAGESIRDFEHRLRTADGSYRDLVWSSVTVPDRKLCFASVRDVTEARLASRRLRVSEERFRLAALAARDVIWDRDVRTGDTWWSNSYQALIGEECAVPDDRDAWLARIHPDDRERVRQGLARAFASRADLWQDQYRYRRASGVYAYVRDRACVVYDADGTPTRMTGSLSDVTELREQAALLDQSSDQIYVLDADDHVIHANTAAHAALGMSEEELLGFPAAQLPVFEAAQLALAQQAVKSRGNWHGELRAQTPGGAACLYDARFQRIDAFAGHAPACLVALTDVTERRKFEAQYLHAQRLESIGTLAGGIAHDLNNVLAPILVAAEMLERESDDTADRRLLASTIGDCARRGAELVRQVLSLSRSDNADAVILRVERLVEEVGRILKETLPPTIQIHTECPADVHDVRGDAAQLRQALLNLCVNARDAMEVGGVLTITTSNVEVDEHYAGMIPGARPGTHVQIAVTDTGTGIPDHVKPRMFEPFFTTKEIGQGTGLGLSTVHAIVKRQGGFVNVYSEVGRGSTFKIYLPASRPDAAAATPAHEPPHGRGETVLLIDDEASIRTISAQTLRVFGYQVILAADGAEGVAQFAKHQAEVEVVLTDMMMPVMDGRAVIRALKSLDPSVRIIAISGLGSNGGSLKSLGSEVKGFLAKPYSAERMLRTIREVIDA